MYVEREFGELPKEVEFRGWQQSGCATIPGFPIFQDVVSGGSFSLLPEETVQEALDRCRRRFKEIEYENEF